MARDASGLSKHVEEARVKAVFERTKGEHWVFWFLFPRLSRTGRLGKKKRRRAKSPIIVQTNV